MAKVWMLAVILVCSAAWLVAQDQSSPSSSSPTSSSSGAQSTSSGQGSPSTSSGETSVEGCLQGSSGSYTLTDNSGMTYQLGGDTSKLAEHVGHEVKITGTMSSASSGAGSSPSTSAAGSSSSSAGGQTLSVDKVEHKAKTCKSASK